MKRVLPILVALLATLVAVGPSLAQSASFFENFGNVVPPAPLAYSNPTNWDIFVQGFDRRGPNLAQHGPNCEPPGFPYTPQNTHTVLSASDAVFICAGHVMTSPGLAGYGAIYMTPPAVMDFSSGPSTLQWEMSTLRTASRDWVDIVLTPLSEHSDLAYNNNDQHIPPDNIHVFLAGTNVFLATQRAGGPLTYDGTMGEPINGDGATTWDQVFARAGLQESPSRRDTFAVALTDSTLSVCMPGYLTPSGGVFCWINNRLPHQLDPNVWHGQAAVMFAHRVYNAEKSCSAEEDDRNIVHNPTGDAQCPNNTWHWDNVSITPNAYFPIIQPTTAGVEINSARGGRVDFVSPAPADARLSFVQFGHTPDLRVSFDDGANWVVPRIQPANAPHDGASEENGEQIVTPIPEGVQSVMVRGSNGFWGTFQAAAFVIIGPTGSSTPPLPTPISRPTSTISPTAAVPTPTATVAPTALPTSTPGSRCQVNVRLDGVEQGWQGCAL